MVIPGSWLIDYLLKHGNENIRARTEEAINSGYLAWHGLPFTTYTELFDEELLDYGLGIAKSLDQRFSKHTIAAKMTDVPGHTRSMITHLAKAGIKYLHLGVNASSHVPHVPELFVWRNSDGSEIVVQYSKDYGNHMVVKDLQEMLYFAHTHDNHGPSSIEQIEQEFARLRETYPNAVIQASTLDSFVEKLWAIRDTLPVVEEEIGDSWIHGAASDPFKLSAYRELLRLKSKWLRDGSLSTEDDEYIAFCDELLMIPEHTWGMDIKRYLADYAHYDKDDFQEARRIDKTDVSLNPQVYRFLEENSRAEINAMFGNEAAEKLNARSYSLMEQSWQEQRNYLNKAIQALHEDRKREAEAAIEALIPVKVHLSTGFKELVSGQTYPLGSFQVEFATDGSIIGLQDTNGKQWAGTHNRIGLFTYETYSQADYDRWYREYHVRWKNNHFWVVGDFGKPGMDLTKEWIMHEAITPELISLTHHRLDEQDTVMAKLKMPHAAAEQMGAPRELMIEYRFPSGDPVVECRLYWFDKDAYR